MRLMIFPRTLRRPNQAHGHVISAAAINPRSEAIPYGSCRVITGPLRLWTAFPPSPVGRDAHGYYGSSATPQRQRRTVRLPRTHQRGFGGHRRDASHVHSYAGWQGRAQLYPWDIAARYRNTARGLAHPTS
jgi:hypothetical protein